MQATYSNVGDAPESDTPLFGASLRWAVYGGAFVFTVLFLFAAFVPLAGGAIASGSISPEGSLRTVQHLEGGIIAQLNARDGDTVSSGSTLVVLDETQSLAEFNISLNRLRTLQVNEARLEAQRLAIDKMTLPFDLESQDEWVRALVTKQTELLLQTIDHKKARIRLFAERSGQYMAEIEGHESSILSFRGQIALLEDEIESGERLLALGAYAKPRLLSLKREATDLNGRVATTRATIAGLQGALNENSAERLEFEASYLTEIATELADLRSEIAGVSEELGALEDVLSRSLIRAPVNGTVVGLKHKTVGGVIKPGEQVLQLVPSDERLIVEARIKPADVDIVSVGQQARVTFTTLPRTLPQFDGTVLRVSADALHDEQTGVSYYQADVLVPMNQENADAVVGQLVPGIPVDVMIISESRTLLSYYIQPMTDAFRKGLRESNNSSELK